MKQIPRVNWATGFGKKVKYGPAASHLQMQGISTSYWRKTA